MQIEELLKCLSLPKRYYGETFVIREKLKEENKKFQRDLKACISDKKQLHGSMQSIKQLNMLRENRKGCFAYWMRR